MWRNEPEVRHSNGRILFDGARRDCVAGDAMTPRATQTVVLDGDKPLMVRVYPDYVEIRRQGDHSYRTMPVSELWRLAAGTESVPPPRTGNTQNSIVAAFVEIRNGKAIWERLDTGYQGTEWQINRQAQREKRPVMCLYCLPRVAT